MPRRDSGTEMMREDVPGRPPGGLFHSATWRCWCVVGRVLMEGGRIEWLNGLGEKRVGLECDRPSDSSLDRQGGGGDHGPHRLSINFKCYS
jgi:hypothetical protein